MTTEFSGVRMAKNADAGRIYDFLLELNKENAVFSLSELRAKQAIATCLEPSANAPGGVIGLIEHGNGIEGCVGLRPSQMWYTAEWFLDELWNFVHPNHRKTDHAKKLIEFAKWSASNLGLPLVMGIVTRNRLAPKMRLYQRQMPQIGAYFCFGKQFEDMYQQRKI
jgi:GNAT superfamily N-acetyltransferase